MSGLRAHLFAVIGIQVHLPDLTHQGIPGIGTGALVVKCLFYHIIQPGKEIRFRDSIVPDGILDADLFLQIFHLCIYIFPFVCF